MTEIDAKAKMKERMAQMRAKRKPKAVVAPKTKGIKIEEGSPAAKTVAVVKAIEKIKAEETIKEWVIKDFADLCNVPEEHLDFFLGAMRIEIRRAIRSKSKIKNFVYNEQHKIQTVLKSEDVFE